MQVLDAGVVEREEERVTTPGRPDLPVVNLGRGMACNYRYDFLVYILYLQGCLYIFVFTIYNTLLSCIFLP